MYARTRRFGAAALAGALLGGAAFGQETQPPQSQLEELREQVYELNKQLRQLELRLEDGEKAAADAEKKKIVVKADGSGFSLTSPDKQFQLRVGGRIGYDFAWFDQDDELKRVIGDENDGTGFRYARIRLQGSLWEYVLFQSEIDFAGESGEDTPKFRDVGVTFKDIVPYGGDRAFDVRLGNFREPFSLEELTGVPYRTFNERSLANAFVPARNAGVTLSDAIFGEPKAERLTWAVGVYKETDDWPSVNDSDEDQGYQITGRVTGLPYYAEEGRKLLHVGLAYSKRNPDGAILPYGVRPETRLSAFRYINPDNLPARFRLRDARADDVDLLGLELAGVYGPFSVQGEYIRSDVDTTFGGDVTVGGHYVQATYFLTGEHRPYRTESGIFDRVVPNKNFAVKNRQGWGAWELTSRYSFADVQDGWLRGGEQTAYTLGLNWYLNPNTRITWNYTHNEVEHDLYDGDFAVLQTRFQVEF